MSAPLRVVARNEQPSPAGQVNLRRLEDDLRRAANYVARAAAIVAGSDSASARAWIEALQHTKADLEGRARLVRAQREGRLR